MKCLGFLGFRGKKLVSYADRLRKLNKRSFRADGLSLLPSALQPRLLGWVEAKCRWMTNFADVRAVEMRQGYVSLRPGVLGVVGFSLVAGFVLQNSYASAASITLTVPSSGLSVSVDPNKDNGFAKSSDALVKVATDGHWGYELNVKAKNDNALKNGSGQTFESITSGISEESFKSETAYNNKWGFRFGIKSEATSGDFVAAPTASNTLIEKTSSANSSSPTSYTFAIAAKADNSPPTGKYSNLFTFSATANSVSYTITYELNEGRWTETNNIQSDSTTEASVKLRSTVPTRDNYEFLGWCAAQTSDESCSGASYDPGADFPLKNDDNTLTLYARWKMSKPTTMQDFGNYCDSMVENQDITLKDTRDGNSYIVTKLKDNRCWMTENLRIIGKDITPSDSDVSEDFSIPTSALWTDTSGNTNHAYYDPEYGGYYTLHTASAGTGNIFQGTIPSSICPKGWKMPSGGSGSELPALLNAYNVSNNSDGAKILMSEPLNFALSGYVNYSNGSLTGQGIYGYYRTSTVYWSASTFHLKIMNNTATTSHDYQGYGYSIRCLAREAVG